MKIDSFNRLIGPMFILVRNTFIGSKIAPYTNFCRFLYPVAAILKISIFDNLGMGRKW